MLNIHYRYFNSTIWNSMCHFTCVICLYTLNFQKRKFEFTFKDLKNQLKKNDLLLIRDWCLNTKYYYWAQVSKNNYHTFSYGPRKITSELLTFMWITYSDRAFVWIISRFTPGGQEAGLLTRGLQNGFDFFLSTSRISCLMRTLRDKFPTRGIYRNSMRCGM